MMIRTAAAFAVFWVCVTRAGADATRPAGFTEHDRIKGQTAAFRHTLVDAYDQDGQHSPLWDVPAHAFLERMAIRFAEANVDSFYESGIPNDNKTMLALAEPLEKCDSPIVNYCRAVIFKDAGMTDEYMSLMRRAAPGVIAGHYPAYRRYWAAAALARTTPNDAKLAAQRDALVLPMLLEPQTDPLQRRHLYKTVIDTVWAFEAEVRSSTKAEARQALLDGMAADTHADRWLLTMLRGAHGIAAAWEARGSGWANTVTPDGWAAFHANIADARAEFEAAYRLEPSYPEAATRMLTVCMAESGSVDDPRVWFDRAIAAQIDYLDAWSAYTSNLQPRWGGTLEAMQALAHEAAETKRFDTGVPYYGLTILHSMTSENGGGEAVYRRPGVWTDVAAILDGYLNPLAHSIDVGWMGTRRAAYAYRCGEYAEALRTLDVLGEQARADAFDFIDVPMAEVREACAALTGPHAAALKAAEADEAAFAFTKARDAYDKVLAALPAADPARAYCLRRRATVAVTADLVDGRPAAIPFAGPDDLIAWSGDPAAWQCKDGVLTYDGPPKSEATLLHRTILPPHCRVNVEWSYSVPQAGHAPGFDVIFQDTAREGYIAVRNYPHNALVTIGLGEKFSLAKSAAPVPQPPDVWHTLQIDHNGTAVTVIEDGQTVLDGYTNDWLAFGKPVLGLRVHSSSVGGAVRVRKLTVERVR